MGASVFDWKRSVKPDVSQTSVKPDEESDAEGEDHGGNPELNVGEDCLDGCGEGQMRLVREFSGWLS